MTLSQNGRPSPLDELYEYAKNKGTITYQEVTDRLGNTFFEADQLDKVLDKLESLGVTATVRRSLGGDIDASCGQLRRKQMQEMGQL